jgi:hypothetical protein
VAEHLLMAWSEDLQEYVKVRCDADGNILVGEISLDEIRLIPKPSSAGAEGTIYYDSDDDHVYVATE